MTTNVLTEAAIAMFISHTPAAPQEVHIVQEVHIRLVEMDRNQLILNRQVATVQPAEEVAPQERVILPEQQVRRPMEGYGNDNRATRS